MGVKFDREKLASKLEEFIYEGGYTKPFEWLRNHLKTTNEELIVDMISDVLDIWLDAHDNKDCETCALTNSEKVYDDG